MLANFRFPAFLFFHGAIQGSICHRALGGASGGMAQPYGMASRPAVSILRYSRRSCARCLIVRGIEVARALSVLQQDEQSVSAYPIEFRMLAISSGWNEKALWDHFLHGVAEHVKDEIYSLELPAGLDRLIDLAIRVDDRIALRSWHRRGEFPREQMRHRRRVCDCL